MAEKPTLKEQKPMQMTIKNRPSVDVVADFKRLEANSLIWPDGRL